MELQAVNLDLEARGLTQFWSQRVVGEANGNLFKVAKGIHETRWHQHDDQEEVFIVTSGELVVQFRTGDVRVGAGELLVVPRGVQHCPRADHVVHFLVVGPDVTSNTVGGKPEWSYDSTEGQEASGNT